MNSFFQDKETQKKVREQEIEINRLSEMLRVTQEHLALLTEKFDHLLEFSEQQGARIERLTRQLRRDSEGRELLRYLAVPALASLLYVLYDKYETITSSSMALSIAMGSLTILTAVLWSGKTPTINVAIPATLFKGANNKKNEDNYKVTHLPSLSPS